jgi:hypothetical protein
MVACLAVVRADLVRFQAERRLLFFLFMFLSSSLLGAVVPNWLGVRAWKVRGLPALAGSIPVGTAPALTASALPSALPSICPFLFHHDVMVSMRLS